MFPTGYLWECIKNRERISERLLWDGPLFERRVFVLWDSLSSEQVRKKDYWKFPKDAALQMNYRDVPEFRPFLPEDMYLVDEDFTFTIIFTHETDLENRVFLFRASWDN